MADFLEKENECVDGQGKHHYNKVEHLEVDEELRPLAYKGVSLDSIFMPMHILIKVYYSLPLYVQFRVLELSNGDPFASPKFTSFLRIIRL